ncbi:hypothetical protein Tco_0785937 [Tanacetum coccineum]
MVWLQGHLPCPTPLPESPTREFKSTSHQYSFNRQRSLTTSLTPFKGVDFLGSASAVESDEASCPDADSECIMVEAENTVNPKEVGPLVACWASLCSSATTTVEAEGWLLALGCTRLLLYLEWPAWDSVASFERDTLLVASILD